MNFSNAIGKGSDKFPQQDNELPAHLILVVCLAMLVLVIFPLRIGA